MTGRPLQIVRLAEIRRCRFDGGRLIRCLVYDNAAVHYPNEPGPVGVLAFWPARTKADNREKRTWVRVSPFCEPRD